MKYEYIITKTAKQKHKKFYNFLLLITYIIFFPCVIVQLLNDLFENILSIMIRFRMQIVNKVFKLFFKKDCLKIEKGEDE